MKIKKKRIRPAAFILAAAFSTLPLTAQVNVGSEKTPQKFSLLEITTANQIGGLRLPLLNNAQRDALNLAAAANPDAAKGLLIYNTDSKSLQYWNGTKWVSFLVPKKD